MSFKDRVTHKTGGKHEFRVAQMDSLLYFYRQEYAQFLPQQNAAMPRRAYAYVALEESNGHEKLRK